MKGIKTENATIQIVAIIRTPLSYSTFVELWYNESRNKGK